MRQHIRPSGLNIGRLAWLKPVFRSLSPLCALALAGALAGCAVAIPLPAALGGDDDVTGTIGKGSPLGPPLDAEDWRRANSALAVALDPQGNGAPVQWSNPQTGSKGSFVQAGRPYPSDAVVCRAFEADLALKTGDHALGGAACVDKSGDWTVKISKPRKKT